MARECLVPRLKNLALSVSCHAHSQNSWNRVYLFNTINHHLQSRHVHSSNGRMSYQVRAYFKKKLDGLNQCSHCGIMDHQLQPGFQFCTSFQLLSFPNGMLIYKNAELPAGCTCLSHKFSTKLTVQLKIEATEVVHYRLLSVQVCCPTVFIRPLSQTNSSFSPFFSLTTTLLKQPRTTLISHGTMKNQAKSLKYISLYCFFMEGIVRIPAVILPISQPQTS